MDSSASSNPDFPGTDGMSFVWYCRDADDELLFNVTHEPVVSPNHQNTTLLANKVSKPSKMLDEVSKPRKFSVYRLL